MRISVIYYLRNKRKEHRTMRTDEEKRSAPKEVRVSLTKRKEKKEKQKRMLRLVIFLSALSVIIIIIMLTMFLKINKVTIVGTTRYPHSEITAVSGVVKGKNILTLNTKETEKSIKKNFPAINSVKVTKKFPSHVAIEVKETEEVMYTAVGEQYYSLDSELRVVASYDSMEEAEMLGLKRIYLKGVTKCITGEVITTEDADIVEMVKQLYNSLVKYELFYDVKEIDFKDKFDIKFKLGVKYEVKLGNILECDTKMEILCGIIEKLPPEEIGTIDFSYGKINKPIFSRS